ncbi:unnamed protein product [Amoebophrya sp. A25]|nr:unnamed protein product [Amoebophrya sp. A25]|eukprot:GSA25T00026627001.1
MRDLMEILRRSNNSDIATRLEILFFTLLSASNIRGSTPLHKVTQYLSAHLVSSLESNSFGGPGGFARGRETRTTSSSAAPSGRDSVGVAAQNNDREELNNDITSNTSATPQHAMPICFNLITDGEPDNRVQFETELKLLCNTFRTSLSVMLTINLCTEDDDVVEYYNDLDKALGNEINGLDVLDDLESEQKEILKAGNTFVTYCEEIHIARMAGCNTVIADSIDEEPLIMFHATKMVKELLGLGRNSGLLGGESPSPAASPERRNSGESQSIGTAAAEGFVSAAQHMAEERIAYQLATKDPYWRDLPNWYEETDDYIAAVKDYNRYVYDWYNRRFRPLVLCDKLSSQIWWYKQKDGAKRFFSGLFGGGGGR